VSSFAGRGKKTVWKIWKVFPEVTNAFEELLQLPSDVSEESMSPSTPRLHTSALHLCACSGNC